MTEESRYQQMEEFYMNSVQLLINVVDANQTFAELARATGKTEGVIVPRMIRVINSMPGELSFLVHKTYVALMTNVWPNIQAAFSRPVVVSGKQRPLLEYGIDYVVGETRLPSHFRMPRYPISFAKHSVVFRNGAHLQLVASDQPDSVAGRNAVHAFIEEMKHNSGDRLRTRLFPALRGGPAQIRKSPYYGGITGVSDTARVELGEDDWFEEYEKNVDQQLVSEIATVALYVNKTLYRIHSFHQQLKESKDPVLIENIRLETQKLQHTLKIWEPRLADMRRNAGPKFFKTQLYTLDTDEFLTSICAIRHKEVTNKFFAAYDRHHHQFSDSYIYDLILKLDLKDRFILTAHFLKHYAPQDELYVGYDPGAFSSLVFAQKKDYGRRLDVIKEFTSYEPVPQQDLASQVQQFFGADAENKVIHLYPDRAGNKTREESQRITTDSRLMKELLEQAGFQVILYNEGQETIYHWQQYKLLLMLFQEQYPSLPIVRIDENECPNLCSAILISPLKSINGKIELDKSSEKKESLKHQAGLTTQLPSAFIYLLYGLYGDVCKKELSVFPTDLPDNLTA